MAGSHDSHSSTISSTACSTIVADGRGPIDAAEHGAEWVRAGLSELPASQAVFATDYPQAVRDDDEVAAYVAAIRALGPEAKAVLEAPKCTKLIPNLVDRLTAGAP